MSILEVFHWYQTPTLSVDRDGKCRFGHESKNQKTAKANRRKEKKSRNPNPNPKGKRVAGPYLGPTAGSTDGHRPRGSPTEGWLAGTQIGAAARGLGTPSPRAGSDRAPPLSRSTAACSHTGEHARRREGRRRRRSYLPRRPPRGCRVFSWREKTGRERMKLGFGGSRRSPVLIRREGRRAVGFDPTAHSPHERAGRFRPKRVPRAGRLGGPGPRCGLGAGRRARAGRPCACWAAVACCRRPKKVNARTVWTSGQFLVWAV